MFGKAVCGLLRKAGSCKQKATAMIDSLIEKYSYRDKSDHPTKMADYLKMWKELQVSEVAETTYDGYHTYIDRHLIPYFKALNINIQDITASHILESFSCLSWLVLPSPRSPLLDSALLRAKHPTL